MNTLKTRPTRVSVRSFLDRIPDETRRKDASTLLKMMQEITGSRPAMWGTSIVGFGTYHYRYPSGHEGDSCLTGFSPRKSDFTLYLMPGLDEHADLLKKLGKHRAGKGCLYVRRLEDVHIPTLRQLIRKSVAHLRKTYG
jgi:hypothetical protein